MQSFYGIPTGALQTRDDWSLALAECAAMGFDGVILQTSPHIFGASSRESEQLPSIVEQARQHDLEVSIDLWIDRAPIDSPEASEMGLADRKPRLRDPRVAPSDKYLIQIPLDNKQVRDEWVRILRQRLADLRHKGISGFCLRSSATLSAAFLAAVTAVDEPSEAAENRPRFWTWISGLEQVQTCKGSGVTAALLPTSSLLRSSTRIYNHAVSTIGDVILCPEPSTAHQTSKAKDPASWERWSVRELWLSAALGSGMMIPMGFEYGLSAAIQRASGAGRSWRDYMRDRPIDISREIIAATAYVSKRNGHGPSGRWEAIRLDSSEMWGAVRHVDYPHAVQVVLTNQSIEREARSPASAISAEVGEYLPLQDALKSEPSVMPEKTITLRPGEVRILEGRRKGVISAATHEDATPEAAAGRPRIIVEAIAPTVDSGRYPVKRIVGDMARVEADAYGEGHDAIAVSLLWRAMDESDWRETPMVALGNDRWSAEFPLERIGRYLYTIEAWRDEFAIYRSELIKKRDAGLSVALELQEGRALLDRMSHRVKGHRAEAVDAILRDLDVAKPSEQLAMLIASETASAYRAADPRDRKVRVEPALQVNAERKTAGFAAWYELFPRSQSGDARRHGTFEDVRKRLPAIQDMGFDVVYFPPIHPIGKTNRKGPNNSLTARPEDPGSPYAIGSPEGGHDAIHPELGDLEDFRRLLAEATKLGLEIALDFAIQASPDHPWLKEHPEWFVWRPDGTIKYAENPPKKYEDIVNVDFYADGAIPSLWAALRETFLIWIERGVKLFRVDNPHTKPFPFWEWLINDIQREHPDVVFLAEAFTRPKVMYHLAKAGFSQSYTYFTWRNTKYEITSYLQELSTEAPKDFFRPHFFVNTPDINPDFLQNAPRSAYLIRAALAATLSGLWGLYNGFEICEGRPDAQRKEYADSEKYEIRVWDWGRPGNIISEIRALNRIRRENAALHSHLGVTFHNAYNDNVIYFQRTSSARENSVLVAINLDPYHIQEADIEVPLWTFGLSDDGSLQVEDLMRDVRFSWVGKRQRIRLDPGELPFSVWRLSRGGDF